MHQNYRRKKSRFNCRRYGGGAYCATDDTRARPWLKVVTARGIRRATRALLQAGRYDKVLKKYKHFFLYEIH